MTTCHRVSNDALCIIVGFGQVVNNKKATTSDTASNNTLCIVVDCALVVKIIRHTLKNTQNKNLYHTRFTRNNDGIHLLIDWGNGERCITGMTEDPSLDRKLYNELKRSRVAKKAAAKRIRQKSTVKIQTHKKKKL